MRTNERTTVIKHDKKKNQWSLELPALLREVNPLIKLLQLQNLPTAFVLRKQMSKGVLI